MNQANMSNKEVGDKEANVDEPDPALHVRGTTGYISYAELNQLSPG